MARLDALLFVVIVMAIALLSVSGARGFYLPRSYPHKCSPGESLIVKVNSLTSIDTSRVLLFSLIDLSIQSVLFSQKDVRFGD